MTPEQREALQKSIEHWEDNVHLAKKHKNVETGAFACACCSLWLLRNCDGCPIIDVTGRLYCDGTYYVDICKLEGTDEYEAITKTCELERDWLKLILDSEVDDEDNRTI